MSMTGHFRHIAPETLEDVEGDSDAVTDLLLADGEPVSALDIDKTWQVVHYLMTECAWGGESPAASAVLGGRQVSDDLGYGPARWLDAEEVREIAAELDRMDPKQLAERFDATKLIALDVYPFAGGAIEDVDDGACQWALDGFESLRGYYRVAARAGHGMLLALL